MLFNSYVFIFLFLPIAFAGFLALGGRGLQRAAIVWIVLASFFFYAWWEPKYLWLISGSMLFNYAMGMLLEKRAGTVRGKTLLALAILANLVVLGHYKYTDFFIHNLNSLFGTSFALQHIVLPFGISFFTFTQIAYLVDTYRSEAKEHNLLDYVLFVVFFPHLVAGPIVHHKDILPQFRRKGVFSFNPEFVAVGGSLFVMGLFKKAVLADGIAKFSSPVFALARGGEDLDFYQAWGGILAYTLQIYFDFSGYSDMAIGLAKMFGVRFPINFHSPYKAWNIIEFWRRWHITLSRFLRDYLYISLGGNRLGPVRRYGNLLLTMFLGGLWHGAGWTYIIWGSLHGLYLIINHAWHGFRKSRGQDLKKFTLGGRMAGGALTFLAVLVAWVFFRAETLDAALRMLRAMAHLRGATDIHLADVKESARQLLWTGGLLAVCWLLPNTQQLMARHEPALDFPPEGETVPPSRWEWRPNWTWAVLITGGFVIAVLHLCKVTEFLYFQF